MDDYLIQVTGLNKTFNKKNKAIRISDLADIFTRNKNSLIKNDKTFKALDDISFKVKRGEFFGIIGRNGSGKSTLLRILLGAMYPDNPQSIVVKASIMRLAMGVGFNQTLTARDNIYINGTILGLSFKEIGEKYHDILEFAEVQEFENTQIKFYSSGMKARLMFAIAINAKSEILLLDEMYGGVGDEAFRKKSENAFADLLSKGTTIVMVSHSMNAIAKNCENVLVLDKGKQLYLGPCDSAIEIYRNNL